MEHAPKRLLPYLEFCSDKESEWYKAGVRCTCGEKSLSISYVGNVSKSIFGKIGLFPCDDSTIALYGNCTHCKQKITLFDSAIDMCDVSPDNGVEGTILHNQLCPKCKNNQWQIQMKFEYPCDENDSSSPQLQWERVSLKCACCGYNAKNYLDMEIE